MGALEGRIALVAGATRGAGRGVARMLGEAGATVYCSGRSARGAPTTGPHRGRPETIEETAELVGAAGGVGVAVRTDHADEQQVVALAERIRAERGRLDILVNVVGGPEVQDRFQPFWKLDVHDGRKLFDAWLWPHVLTCRHAIPLLIARERRTPGLIVEVMEGETLGYTGHFYFDLATTALKRLAHALAQELVERRVASIAVAPGFMRTEAILAHFGATETTWQEVARTNKEAIGYGFAGSETPCFVGRAIAALAADPEVMRRSGNLFGSWELAVDYGFTDVDGGRPNWGRYFAENFAGMFGTSAVGVEWKVAGVTLARRA